MAAPESCRLYLVTPPVLAPARFRDTLAAALDAGDVAAVQLRLKGWSEDDLLRAIDVLRPVAQSRGVAFLLNDNPDLAVRSSCDGAHVGQEDMPAAEARRVLGDLMLGVTCHGSRDLAMVAGQAGADYVAFGAFFPSTTKAPPAMADPEILTWWSELMELPCVAIGGSRRRIAVRWCGRGRISWRSRPRCGRIRPARPPRCARSTPPSPQPTARLRRPSARAAH